MSERPAGKARLAVFLLVVAAVSGALVLYALRQRPPLLPADLDHIRSLEPVQCLACHGPGLKDARGPNHPLNDQCFNCHQRA